MVNLLECRIQFSTINIFLNDTDMPFPVQHIRFVSDEFRGEWYRIYLN